MLHFRTGKLPRLTGPRRSLLGAICLLALATPVLAVERRPNIPTPQPGQSPAPTPQPVRIPEGSRVLPPGQPANPNPPPVINPAVLINNQIQQQGVLQVPRLSEVNKYLTTTTQPAGGRSSEGNVRGIRFPRSGEPQAIQFSPNIVIVLDDNSGINSQLSAASRGFLPGTTRFGDGDQTQVFLESSESTRPILIFKRNRDGDRTLQASENNTEAEATDNETNNSVVLIDRTLPEDKTLIQTRQQFLFPNQVLLRVGSDGTLQSINPR